MDILWFPLEGKIHQVSMKPKTNGDTIEAFDKSDKPASHIVAREVKHLGGDDYEILIYPHDKYGTRLKVKRVEQPPAKD